jgi:hypothetical protein
MLNLEKFFMYRPDYSTLSTYDGYNITFVALTPQNTVSAIYTLSSSYGNIPRELHINVSKLKSLQEC